MTKEEEIRANVSVNVVQRAWEAMANQAIESGILAETLKLRVEMLEKELETLKNPNG